MNRRSCLNHPDRFCYVCGKFTQASQKKNSTKSVKVEYKNYLGCKKVTIYMLRKLLTGLALWLNGKQKSMSFAVPMMWWEPTNYANDCYFCLTKFLIIQNALSPGLCIQTALQHYVLSLICMKTFQFPLLFLCFRAR